MDGTRFDGLTRALATGATRRRTLLGVAGSALAGLLGLAGIEEAAAACVKAGKKGCNGPKNGKCCDGARCTRGNKTTEGRCVCLRSLKQCGRECVNLKTNKENCGSCNNRCRGARSCTNGACVSVLGCRAGDQYCNNFAGCPEVPPA